MLGDSEGKREQQGTSEQSEQIFVNVWGHGLGGKGQAAPQVW